MKKVYLFIFTIFTLFLFTNKASANTINSIKTDVYIDEYGNGQVTEVWNVNLDEGTEGYHSFGNLEDRTITNYEVSMDGIPYTNIYSWDVNASKSEKQYKNGVNYTSDGQELCWGIEYGTHTYTLKYTVNNLVWQYKDNQILYFAFIPQNMNQTINDFKLTISGYKSFSNIKYSSYGFKSNNSIQNGQIIFQSNKITSNEYVVALVGFPNGTFTDLKVTKDQTYDDIVDEALQGATLNKRKSFFETLIIILNVLIPFVVVGLAVRYAIRKQPRTDKSEFIIPKDKDINNFRDIPFDKDIIKAYYIGNQENIMYDSYIMGSIILKWIKEEKIKMVQNESGVFNKNENYYIDLTNLTDLKTQPEIALASIFKAAATDNKLTPKDFTKYCKKHYQQIDSWISGVKDYSKKLLIDENYIETYEENYSKKGKRKVYKYTTKLKDEFIKLKGLKKFLNDMTLIDDKKAIEVHIWDEYLIFAQAFGIADKVAKQFQKFHPEEYTGDIYYGNYVWVNSFSSNAYRAASQARTAASSGGSFSGGGTSSGGFSSGGGGFR